MSHRIQQLGFGLLLGVLSLMPFSPALAEEKPDAMAQWQTLSPQADEFAAQGDFLTSAGHNPRVKDYYKASKMYAQAATLYQQGSYIFLNAVKVEHEAPENHAQLQHELDNKAQKYIFKSFQATRVGANRESRGLL